MGAALAAYGIDLDLAPVVDVNIDPLNPVIGIRSFGADPVSVRGTPRRSSRDSRVPV